MFEQTLYIRVIKDITDPTGDTDLFIAKNTVMRVLEYAFDGTAIAEYGIDNQVALTRDEYEPIEDEEEAGT